ncbi:MAG: hypothetical protein HQ579_03905 [Candidatus Omnitrophica bacterium]|nr:hypothetical protein [Candidatus Omnitrophota bacterium]
MKTLILLLTIVMLCSGYTIGRFEKEKDLEEKYRKALVSPTYLEKVSLDTTCWVQGLKKIEELQESSLFAGARMIIGEFFEGGIRHKDYHVWIEYAMKDRLRDGFQLYTYDPTRDKLIRVRWAYTLNKVDGWRGKNKGYINIKYKKEN